MRGVLSVSLPGQRLEGMGCEVLMIGHAQPELEREALSSFMPDLAIVDSIFQNDTDGVDIAKFFWLHFKDLPVVICTRLLDEPKPANWAYNLYHNLPNVKAGAGKRPFPSGKDLRWSRRPTRRNET